MPAGRSFADMDAGPSPADQISKHWRLVHTVLETVNLLPALYLTLSFALLGHPKHCEDPDYWGMYTITDPETHVRTKYDNPCDLYEELEMAGHWLLLVCNIIALGGACGVLTKRFWANHFILDQYLYANVVGLVGAVVSFVGCLELYHAASSYDAWLSSQGEQVRESHEREHETMLYFISFFYKFSIWSFIVTTVRVVALAVVIRHKYCGDGMRRTLLSIQRDAVAKSDGAMPTASAVRP